MHKTRSTTVVRASALAVSLLLFASIVLGFVFPVPAAVHAETIEQALKAAQQRQADLDANIARLEQESAQLAANKNEVDGKLAWINARSAEQRALYAEKTQQLAEAMRTMADANQAFIDASDTLAAKKEQYRSRLQNMFSHRRKSYFQVFIEAGSIKNFFTTIQFMSLVAESDQIMIDDLRTAQENADLQQKIAAETREDMEAVVASLESQLNLLKAQESATVNELESIQLKLSRAETAEDALNEESNRLDGEITALQQKLEAELSAKATAAAQATAAAKATEAAKAAAAKSAAEKAAAAARAAERAKKPTSNSRGWVWPYPGDRNVYSAYGWRIHPVYRTRRFHTGVDLGGSYGKPIVAARSGVVILVRNPVQGSNKGGSGYGNYVVLAHDGGYSTLYGHMKNTLVRVGQSVSAGDRIGTCGSTGTSTGPHLHFEVRVNGSTTNPLPYIR